MTTEELTFERNGMTWSVRILPSHHSAGRPAVEADLRAVGWVPAEEREELDLNWQRHHDGCMNALRALLHLPDGTVPDMMKAITTERAAREKAEAEHAAAADLLIQRAYDAEARAEKAEARAAELERVVGEVREDAERGALVRDAGTPPTGSPPAEHQSCDGTCGGEWLCPNCHRLVGYCHGTNEPPNWCDPCWSAYHAGREVAQPTGSLHRVIDARDAILRCLMLYGVHTVNSRGPYGLLFDALEALDPPTVKRLRDGETPTEVAADLLRDEEFCRVAEMRDLSAASSPRCHGGRDGECAWSQCPQTRDGEPERTGRHCPLDIDMDGEPPAGNAGESGGMKTTAGAPLSEPVKLTVIVNGKEHPVAVPGHRTMAEVCDKVREDRDERTLADYKLRDVSGNVIPYHALAESLGEPWRMFLTLHVVPKNAVESGSVMGDLLQRARDADALPLEAMAVESAHILADLITCIIAWERHMREQRCTAEGGSDG